MDRSKKWALRCAHEAQYHEANAFVTLTYEKEPPSGSLQHEDFQGFVKRLRDRIQPTRMRFYMCGEYGAVYEPNGVKVPGALGRAHYHAIVFGYDFPDRSLWKKSNTGFNIYRSDLLEETWKLGHAVTQDFSFEAAAYIARYITKKMSGPISEEHYKKVNLSTGELHQVKPEYTSMSTKPGIGRQWLIDNHADVYPKDFVTHQGVKFKAPAYYDALFESIDPEMLQAIKLKRATAAKENQDPPERLEVRETICQIKSDKLERD